MIGCGGTDLRAGRTGNGLPDDSSPGGSASGETRATFETPTQLYVHYNIG